MFKSLDLDQEVSVLFKSPSLNSWVSYVNFLDENPYELLLTRLKTRFSDEGLATVLALTKRYYTTRKIAENLEKAQLDGWLRHGEDAESILSS